MNVLRKYIRQVMLEDLGRQVWADRANADSRHFGTEPNTQREDDLWASIWSYLIDDVGDALGASDVQDILRYAQDPRYSDVFAQYTGAAPLYRGMQLPKDLVDGLLGANRPGHPSEEQKKRYISIEHPEPIFSDPAPVNFVYTPDKFHREGVVSSWTTNYTVAMDFASDVYKAKSHDWIAAVLITDSSGGDFLDINPLYSYDKLWWHEKEEEVMGLGPIRVKAIRVEV